VYAFDEEDGCDDGGESAADEALGMVWEDGGACEVAVGDEVEAGAEDGGGEEEAELAAVEEESGQRG